MNTLLAIGVLMAITAAVLLAVRAPHPAAPTLAILRGAAQLAAVSLILSGVIRSRLWVGAALAVMFTVAAFTATRRIGWSGRHAGLVVGAMAAGIGASLVVVFGTGAIEFSARYVLAIGGIVIGNAMTVTTLAGRRLTEGIIARWDEVEAWLSVGATPRQATLQMAREAVYSALIPPIDQTRTTGLVTLPGAFVGAIFGGLSPLEAGRFQIVVLASLMAADAITAAIVVRMLAPVTVRPVPLA